MIYIETCLFFRQEDGINVIFISDITKDGKKPQKCLWVFKEMIELIQEGKLSILRFNLLDVQVLRIGNNYICFTCISYSIIMYYIHTSPCNVVISFKEL